MLRVLSTWTAPQGGPYYTNLHYIGVDAAQAAQAHADTAELFDILVPQISSAYEVTVESEVEEVDPVTGQIQQVFAETPVTHVGESTGQPLPFTTQGLIRWSTGVYQNGRQVRGRTFIPGLTENSTQGGAPDAAFVNTVTGLIQAWLGNVSAGNDLAIWSPTAGTATSVNGAQLWNQFAVLRSRRD